VAEDSNYSIRPYEGSDPYVFICYSHADTEVYDQIRWLQEQGVNVWYDQGITPGSEWSEALAKKIEGCDSFLYFVSKSSVESEHCKRELIFAQDERKRILAIQIEHFELPSGIRLSLRNRQLINRCHLSEEEFNARMLSVLDRKSLEPEPLPRSQDTSPSTGERPSIAVLAFDNLSGDPGQEYFSDGITEEVIAKLSLNPMLNVIARNSTFYYKGKQVLPKQIGEELDARYIVGGSVRKAGDRIRITAQLIDATTNRHMWTERYDRKYDLKQLLDIQDEIAERIVANLKAGYDAAESKRVRRIPTESLNAYECVLRGYGYNISTTEGNAKAQQLFRRAIELDPDYAEAYPALGTAIAQGTLRVGSERMDLLQAAEELAKRAIALDASCAPGYLLLAQIYGGYSPIQTEEALAEIERAIELNPSYAHAYGTKGNILANSRRPTEAIDALEMAVRLSPHEKPLWNYPFGKTYQFMGQYDEAIPYLKDGIRHNPHFPPNYYHLSATYLDQWKLQHSHDPEILDKAIDIAQKNIAKEGLISWCHETLIMAYIQKKQYAQAIEEANSAIKLGKWGPLAGKSLGLYAIASIHCLTGEQGKAISELESTQQPAEIHSLVLAQAYYLIGQHQAAIDAIPAFSSHSLAYEGHVVRAIIFSELNRTNEAGAAAAEVLKLVPGFSVDIWGERNPMKDREQVERDMAALRKAGLN